jgi:hypothetical protein
MTKANSMHERLKEARQKAGYKTATAAIDAFGWSSSTTEPMRMGRMVLNPAMLSSTGKHTG